MEVMKLKPLMPVCCVVWEATAVYVMTRDFWGVRGRWSAARMEGRWRERLQQAGAQ